LKLKTGKQKVVTQLGIWVETTAKLSTLESIFTLCQKFLTCATEIIWRQRKKTQQLKDSHSNISAYEDVMN